MSKFLGKKILIATSSFAVLDKSPIHLLEKRGVKVVDNPYKRRLTKQELLELLSEGITGIVAGLEPLDEEVIMSSGLKVISRCGSGMSNVDIQAAKEKGVEVYNTPDAPVDSVAELTLGAMLNLLRRVIDMDGDLHNNEWNKKIGSLLKGKTVAIIGFGRIGRRLRDLLVPFDVKILIVDPLPVGEPEDAKISSFEDALKLADIISIHSAGEECIIGEKEFGLMKKGVFLLNAARGALVNETGLITALEEGRVKGAWLDVFDQEPYTGQLTKFKQVILTPHVGSYTEECRLNMETEAVKNLIKGLEKTKEE